MTPRILCALAALTGCSTSSWQRTVTIRETSHTRLALTTPADRECFARCTQTTAFVSCLAACPGSVQASGSCDAFDPSQWACQISASTHPAVSTEGRCSDLHLLPNESLASCSDHEVRDHHIGAIVAGVIAAVFLVALVGYGIGQTNTH